jgi:heme oxygenase
MAPVRDRAQQPDESLRTHLRAATMAAHDLLDHAMQAASGWQTCEDYARFLALQYAARLPLEAWLAEHAPADLAPPLQTPLLARDLATLGADLPPHGPAFTDAAPRPGQALGTVWVLAGSALGNKAIAKQVTERHQIPMPTSARAIASDRVLAGLVLTAAQQHNA